jgi:flagellar hook-basal body complex protein FliE
MVDSAAMTGPGGLAPVGPGAPAAPASAPEGKSFADILKESIERANQLQKESEALQASLAAGETDNVEEVMIAVRKAELAFETLMQIRNKLIDAYDELQRMRI